MWWLFEILVGMLEDGLLEDGEGVGAGVGVGVGAGVGEGVGAEVVAVIKASTP